MMHRGTGVAQAEKGVAWEDEPPFFRFGTYVKKEEYTKAAYNPRTQEAVSARRTRSSARSFALDEEAAADWLLARFWPEDLDGNVKVDGGVSKERNEGGGTGAGQGFPVGGARRDASQGDGRDA